MKFFDQKKIAKTNESSFCLACQMSGSLIELITMYVKCGTNTLKSHIVASDRPKAL